MHLVLHARCIEDKVAVDTCKNSKTPLARTPLQSFEHPPVSPPHLREFVHLLVWFQAPILLPAKVVPTALLASRSVLALLDRPIPMKPTGRQSLRTLPPPPSLDNSDKTKPPRQDVLTMLPIYAVCRTTGA